MTNHFRTAVLTVILAGGTLASYATAYAMMDAPATAAVVASPDPVRVQVSVSAAKRLLAGQSDVSVREACSTFEGAGSRNRCMQDMAAAPRPVRVIDVVSNDSKTLVR